MKAQVLVPSNNPKSYLICGSSRINYEPEMEMSPCGGEPKRNSDPKIISDLPLRIFKCVLQYDGFDLRLRLIEHSEWND